MRLFLSVAMLSVVVGYLTGGRLSSLEALQLRWWGLAPLGLAMQLVPLPWSGGAARTAALGLLLASYPVLMAFAVKNLRLAGFPLVLVGLALNLTVIAVNNGMPVSCDALVASGQGDLCADLRREPALKHHLAGPDDDLMLLADVIPIATPVNQVVSVGDLIAYGGLLWLVAATMTGRPLLVRSRRHSDDAR